MSVFSPNLLVLDSLQVIEKRDGKGESSEQEQVKERITAQLEASSEHIRVLEARLERLKSSTSLDIFFSVSTHPQILLPNVFEGRNRD